MSFLTPDTDPCDLCPAFFYAVDDLFISSFSSTLNLDSYLYEYKKNTPEGVFFLFPVKEFRLGRQSPNR
jgi:hypothetical protein